MSDKTREDFEAWAASAAEAMKQAHTHLMFAAACNGVTVLDSVGAQETCEALHEAVEGLKSVKAATQHSAARIAELEAEEQALRRDAERLAEKAATHDAINRACKELPPGYDLHIELEKDAGIVRLYLPDTDADISDFGSDLGFVGEINAAVDAAIEAERAKP